MNRMKMLLPLIVMAIFLALPAWAQAPKYDAGAEVTLHGEVLYASEHLAAWPGLFAVMKDGKNEIVVHLAPQSFLGQQGVNIQRSSAITVVGSRVQWNGSEYILAREVTTGSTRVTLRDKQGNPLW